VVVGADAKAFGWLGEDRCRASGATAKPATSKPSVDRMSTRQYAGLFTVETVCNLPRRFLPA